MNDKVSSFIYSLDYIFSNSYKSKHLVEEQNNEYP